MQKESKSCLARKYVFCFYSPARFLLAITSVYSCMRGSALGACAGRMDQLLLTSTVSSCRHE